MVIDYISSNKNKIIISKPKNSIFIYFRHPVPSCFDFKVTSKKVMIFSREQAYIPPLFPIRMSISELHHAMVF